MQISIKAKIKWHYMWRKIKMLIAKDKRGVYVMGRTPLSLLGSQGTYPVEKELIRWAGYNYNYWSFQYKHCVVDMRKLYIDYSGDEYALRGKIRQIHVRVFDDSVVTIHDEWAYEEDALAHIDAVSLKLPSKEEILLVARVLKMTKNEGNLYIV